MDDYYFFRFMHKLVSSKDSEELASLHGIAQALPESDLDRSELLRSIEDRCHILGVSVPEAIPPEDLNWSGLFPPFHSPTTEGVINIDADPWNADWLRHDLPPEYREPDELRRWVGQDMESALEFRATPLYARVRNRYPWIRELWASPPSGPIDHTGPP